MIDLKPNFIFQGNYLVNATFAKQKGLDPFLPLKGKEMTEKS
jgi:hypothetical protein